MYTYSFFLIIFYILPDQSNYWTNMTYIPWFSLSSCFCDDIVTSCSRVAHRPAVRLSGLCWGWVKWQLPPTPRAQSPCQPMKSSALSQAATTSPGPFWTSTSLCWWTTRYDCHQTSYVTLLKNLLKFTFFFFKRSFPDGVCWKDGWKWRRDIRCQYPFQLDYVTS